MKLRPAPPLRPRCKLPGDPTITFRGGSCRPMTNIGTSFRLSAAQMIDQSRPEPGYHRLMRRYYFDVRIGGHSVEDHEGFGLEAVQREALRVLANTTKTLIAFPASMSVEVRDEV